MIRARKSRSGSKRSRGGNSSKKRRRYILLSSIIVALAIALIAASYLFLSGQHSATPQQTKPIILYVNQGNGVVNESNFSNLLMVASSHGFNTIFFQIYRSGDLLFTSDELQYFVAHAHAQGLKIFFALYFTGSSQQIPTSIYGLGQDGINLDMSTLPSASQASLLQTLKDGYTEGKTAVTTTNFGSNLTPDLLILETYVPADQQYMHKGIIGSVEVVATISSQEYNQQVQYALNNSDGVMVFDYAGLVKSGY